MMNTENNSAATCPVAATSTTDAKNHAPVSKGTGESKLLSRCEGPKPSMLGWRGNALRFFSNPVDYMVYLRSDFGEVAALTSTTNQPLFSRGDRAISARHPDSPRTVFGFGAEANRTILTQLDVFQTRPPRGPATEDFRDLSNNVLFANGTDHERRRKLMLPIFNRNSLTAYHPHMTRFANQMMEGWRSGNSIELNSEMSLVSLNIASKCLYGLEPEREKIGLAAQMRNMVRLMFSPAVLVPLNVPGTPYHRLNRDLHSVRRGLQSEVERLERSEAFGEDVLSIMVKRHLEETGTVDIDEIVGEAFVMFFAGHDTTSKGLCWTLYLLAQHPKVAKKLKEELSENVSGDAPTYEQLFTLDYLDRVVKESLRVLSPAVMFPRFAVTDTEMCGVEIPKGTEIVYSPYVTHMDPSVFPSPRRFDPDRWIDFKATPYQYLPFGAGRRTCLGMTLGTLTIKLITAMIVLRFQLRAVPNSRIDLDTNVVMGPKPSMPMVVHAGSMEYPHPPVSIQGYLSRMVDLPQF